MGDAVCGLREKEGEREREAGRGRRTRREVESREDKGLICEGGAESVLGDCHARCSI